MSTASLELIPPRARFAPRSLSDEENALPLWKKAIELFREGTAAEQDAVLTIFHGNDDGTPASIPTGDDRRRIDRLFVSNRACFDAIDAGARRRGLQLEIPPDVASIETDTRHIAMQVSRIAQWRRVYVHLLAADGQTAAAVQELLAVLRMGEVLCNGEGMASDYMLGAATRGSAKRRLRELIESDRLPIDTARLALDAIEQSLSRPDGFASSLRAELCCYIVPRIETLDDSSTAATLDDFLKNHYDDTTMTERLSDELGTEKLPEDIRAERVALRREQIERLVAGHPCLFDRQATIELVVEHKLRNIDWIESYEKSASPARHGLLQWLRSDKAKPQDEWFDIATAAAESAGKPRLLKRIRNHFEHRLVRTANATWPQALLPGVPFDYFGADPLAAAQREQLRAHLPDLSVLEPLSDAQLKAANKRLRRLPNPIGILIFKSHCSLDVSKFAIEHRQNLFWLRDALQRQLRDPAGRRRTLREASSEPLALWGDSARRHSL